MNIYQLADLYDEQYLSYRDDIPHYLRLADDHGGPVLELGAGTGRLSVALARAGHEVVAIDNSMPMLERARERLRELGPAGRVHLVEGDMRRIDLASGQWAGKRFPLVIAAFNTLMHAYTLDDQDATLAGVLDHLEPAGAFAFDLFMPPFGPTGVVRREREWESVGGEGSELFLVQEHDSAAQLIESRYHLDTTLADGTVKRRTARLTQRYYTRFEIERALRQAGFSRLRLQGDFEGRPFVEGSRHLVAVARR